MKNRVTVTIAGQEYTLVGTEEASYTEKVAAHVDAKVEEVLSGAHVSLVDGAILAAVNIADEYFKEVEAAENLRRQLKEYLEEATKMKRPAGGPAEGPGGGAGAPALRDLRQAAPGGGHRPGTAAHHHPDHRRLPAGRQRSGARHRGDPG